MFSKSDNLVKMLFENISYVTMGATIIGIITLLGAAIGLMNIMLVSVAERTREIGIRKALGATRFSIKRQFLVEAIVICQLGGILGIILGIAAGKPYLFLHKRRLCGSLVVDNRWNIYLLWCWTCRGYLSGYESCQP